MTDLFPRSAAYDEDWVNENRMGPNVLGLAESVAERMTLEPGMRVMDLGCGKALSSVFLAREFGVEVWATDLWIQAGGELGAHPGGGTAESDAIWEEFIPHTEPQEQAAIRDDAAGERVLNFARVVARKPQASP